MRSSAVRRYGTERTVIDQEGQAPSSRHGSHVVDPGLEDRVDSRVYDIRRRHPTPDRERSVRVVQDQSRVQSTQNDIEIRTLL
jgi:hypothetical protein